MTGQRHRVVVVGGGFGGINVTRALARADADVTIVDRTNHHLFQPLLYQVAAGILAEGLIAPALRSVVRSQQNTRTVLADVQDLDVKGRVVSAVAPDGRELLLPYDTLVVASGATDAYFGHDEWAEFAPGMKTLEDARDLRSHILSAFEMAELATDPAERAAYLTFVVVGGVARAIKDRFTIAGALDHDRPVRRAALGEVIGAVRHRREVVVAGMRHAIHVMEAVADIEAGMHQDRIARLHTRRKSMVMVGRR